MALGIKSNYPRICASLYNWFLSCIFPWVLHSYNMVGHCKFCLTLIGAFLLFHDSLQPLQVVGVSLAFSGSNPFYFVNAHFSWRKMIVFTGGLWKTKTSCTSPFLVTWVMGMALACNSFPVQCCLPENRIKMQHKTGSFNSWGDKESWAAGRSKLSFFILTWFTAVSLVHLFTSWTEIFGCSSLSTIHKAWKKATVSAQNGD